MKKTIVVLAAGMGSRFGGLKQVEVVGPNGEFIIDYSIYDAICAGFSKVVFIIKKEMQEVFHETIGKRLANKIEVVYAYQDMSILPENINIPSSRIKPLGTAHALYCAKDVIHEDFVIISADDFYGKEAFEVASKFLDESNNYGVIGYELGSTLPSSGAVKRGICFTDNKVLTDIVECLVKKEGKKIKATALEDNKEYILDEHQPVSMLMYVLRKDIFTYLEKDIKTFFKDKDLETVEYLLPSVLDQAMKEKAINIDLVLTKAKWLGITYKEDLEDLKEAIKQLIEKGEEPINLWG